MRAVRIPAKVSAALPLVSCMIAFPACSPSAAPTPEDKGDSEPQPASIVSEVVSRTFKIAPSDTSELPGMFDVRVEVKGVTYADLLHRFAIGNRPGDRFAGTKVLII